MDRKDKNQQLLNLCNKPVIIYKKDFENISNLIKNLAPHQLIEIKFNEQMEGINTISKTMQNMTNILQSWKMKEMVNN
jgi:hypothetical protein